MYDFIVTGGCGFIGSHFIELVLLKGYTVLNIDKMTYVSWNNIGFEKNSNYSFWRQDICEISNLPKCDYLVNFAAESFVDNSIENSGIFFKSNVQGVHILLEHIRMKTKFDRPLFVQVSTDEVYGDTDNGKFTETDPLCPSNPYSATKAAAEQFLYAYARTYGIEYLITRCSNNYGIRQYPEKLIPKTIICALTGRKIPVHGDGSYIRSWISVQDHCEAIYDLIMSKKRNEIYNICSEQEWSNIEVINLIYSLMNVPPNIAFVENRWGQDIRYALSTEKIFQDIQWKSKRNFKDDIPELIQYYRGLHGADSKAF